MIRRVPATPMGYCILLVLLVAMGKGLSTAADDLTACRLVLSDPAVAESLLPSKISTSCTPDVIRALLALDETGAAQTELEIHSSRSCVTHQRGCSPVVVAQVLDIVSSKLPPIGQQRTAAVVPMLKAGAVKPEVGLHDVKVNDCIVAASKLQAKRDALAQAERRFAAMEPSKAAVWWHEAQWVFLHLADEIAFTVAKHYFALATLVVLPTILFGVIQWTFADGTCASLRRKIQRESQHMPVHAAVKTLLDEAEHAVATERINKRLRFVTATVSLVTAGCCTWALGQAILYGALGGLLGALTWVVTLGNVWLVQCAVVGVLIVYVGWTAVRGFGAALWDLVTPTPAERALEDAISNAMHQAKAASRSPSRGGQALLWESERLSSARRTAAPLKVSHQLPSSEPRQRAPLRLLVDEEAPRSRSRSPSPPPARPNVAPATKKSHSKPSASQPSGQHGKKAFKARQ